MAKLPEDFIPTDLHWLILGGRSSGGGKGSDTLLISSNDGRFVILNKSSRVERSITAHTAAISSGRWSPDAAGLLTGTQPIFLIYLEKILHFSLLFHIKLVKMALLKSGPGPACCVLLLFKLTSPYAVLVGHPTQVL